VRYRYHPKLTVRSSGGGHRACQAVRVNSILNNITHVFLFLNLLRFEHKDLMPSFLMPKGSRNSPGVREIRFCSGYLKPPNRPNLDFRLMEWAIEHIHG
jgi:hypothetical protein